MEYNFKKEINVEKLNDEIKQIFESDFQGLSYLENTKELVVYFKTKLSKVQIQQLNSIVENHQIISQFDKIDMLVEDAIKFGQQILKEFIVENILLGITQRGLTNHIRQVTSEVITCLQIGSLHDAITELKKINPNDLDDIILTSTRLLNFRNKIHDFLGLPGAQNWNE